MSGSFKRIAGPPSASEAALLAVSSESDATELAKQQHGIASRFRSCHTAVSTDDYVVEGHVPAKLIHKFLTEIPAVVLGLAQPVQREAQC